MVKNKEVRTKIIAQALQEIVFDRQHKQGKIPNWQKNENMYYSHKDNTVQSRANVDLARMQEFVHTLLSKVDNPLTFTFTKRKEAQLKRVTRLNALRKIDSDEGDWDIKDLVGKKQGVIYGRAIYSYYADSYDGYSSHLDPVDVYDFLIDPAGGGIDIEKARNMGRYGVVKDKRELEEGVKDKRYLKEETKRLIDGSGNSTETSPEENNKRNRILDQNVTQQKESGVDTDKFKFWEWFTTFEGVRYYLLMTETAGTAIVVQELTEMFPATKKYPRGPWPFWSWAAFPDLTEFWTPSYCDYAREIFMAQSVSINQAMDNSEQINKPQKAVDVGAIENLAELKYRRDGYIQFKKGTDINKALQVLQTPAIDTPLKVYEILDGIQEKASGVTSGSKGISSEDKVGIYEGNQAAAADRFGLLNKSYAFGYKRFAKLYELGVREHLTKKTAVDMIGPTGVESEMVSKRDIFRKSEEFGINVQASDAEDAASAIDKKNKIQFIDGKVANPATAGILNQKKAFEMEAAIVGFTEDEVKALLDVSEYGTMQILSQADEDIESLLDGNEIKPNRGANIAYKQRFVDFLNSQEEKISHEQFMKIARYIQSLEEVIMRNTVREMQDKINKMQIPPPPMPVAPNQPLQPDGGSGGLAINPVPINNGQATAA